MRSNGWVGDGLRQQVAPGVVPVAVAPVLGLAVDGDGRAVGARVLRGGQPVQLIVREGLVAGVLAVVEDSPDIAVVPVAQVEVIGDGKDFVRERERGTVGHPFTRPARDISLAFNLFS